MIASHSRVPNLNVQEYRLKVRDRPALERTFSFIQVLAHTRIRRVTSSRELTLWPRSKTTASGDRATHRRPSLSSRAFSPTPASRACRGCRRTWAWSCPPTRPGSPIRRSTRRPRPTPPCRHRQRRRPPRQPRRRHPWPCGSHHSAMVRPWPLCRPSARPRSICTRLPIPNP
jgi:hypothetical protein